MYQSLASQGPSLGLPAILKLEPHCLAVKNKFCDFPPFIGSTIVYRIGVTSQMRVLVLKIIMRT